MYSKCSIPQRIKKHYKAHSDLRSIWTWGKESAYK